MADSGKAQKLAAARKKLKEYKKTQSNRKVIKNDEEIIDTKKSTSSENVTPAESMASSTHSIQENDKITIETQPNDTVLDNNSTAVGFNSMIFKNNNELSSYFDTLSVGSSNLEQFLHSESNELNNQNSLSADPFALSVQEQKSLNENNTQSQSTKQMTPERQTSECALEDYSQNQNIFSNTESLRQLSSQLNSLIDNDISHISGVSELEKRNQDLAASLKNEQLKTEQLNLQLREYVTRVTQLENELQQVKTDYDTKLSRETGPLQEQLQYHVQTVGILVGEKTELTIALNQSQTTAKQKTSECEELQGRLKASRHRVSELEKEVNVLKSFRENFDKHEQENKEEFERLKTEHNLIKEQFREISEECAELREKLNSKIFECDKLQNEIQDKNSQLSLAQIKIQQLTSGGNLDIESQLEVLNQQKISLEQQVSELTQSIKAVTGERDQASQQYQQYVQQLNGQIQNLAECLETKNIENENLSKREQSLIKHIGELEKHLQNLQNEREVFKPNNEIENILRNEKTELEEKLSEEMNKRNELEAQVQQKDEIILELETKIERLKDQPDADKLLAAMESDKIAASRAVEQNKKLKQQLEELHDGFIKMSNNKLELTEKLQSEQYLNKELSEKLSQNTSIIEHLHSVIAIKDKELTDVQNRETELQKEVLQHNQLTDRLRHYEAQGNTSDFIQQELQEARQKIFKLTAENDALTLNLKKIQEENSINNKNLTDNIETNLNITEFDRNKQNLVKIESESDLEKEKAMQQLEERFKKTMAEVAELTEEKQRLEHLVLQLQSETETIGEYVTLYQCQRAMLKEKSLEKDEQLKRLALDREEMKIKLNELNNLVQKLIIEKKEYQNIAHESCDKHNGNTENEEKINNNNENGTAGKIINLLSEIKTSNLVEPGDNSQNFHPCPWCSGQLITV